jgi:hypothetical protein
MKVTVQTPALDRNLAKLAGMVRNKAGFVKAWANSAAMEARETARG